MLKTFFSFQKVDADQIIYELSGAQQKYDIHTSAKSAAERAHAIVICTEWDEFKVSI